LPQRGRRAKLLRLAEANAKLLLGEKRRETEARDRVPHSLTTLQQVLHLEEPPRLIEAFDISNLQGAQTTGSLVVFKDGRPLKSEYRSFNIKSVTGIDDFASMAEVIKRRYKRQKSEEQELPDLILVDGGRGQLSAAQKSLAELEITEVTLIGLAKRLDEVYTVYEAEPLNIPNTSSALKILQQVRDEAHRVAITRHRRRRKRLSIASTLDEITGVGEARKKLLIKHFGSVKKVSEASCEELKAAGLDAKTAKSIESFFRGNKQ